MFLLRLLTRSCRFTTQKLLLLKNEFVGLSADLRRAYKRIEINHILRVFHPLLKALSCTKKFSKIEMP